MISNFTIFTRSSSGTRKGSGVLFRGLSALRVIPFLALLSFAGCSSVPITPRVAVPVPKIKPQVERAQRIAVQVDNAASSADKARADALEVQVALSAGNVAKGQERIADTIAEIDRLRQELAAAKQDTEPLKTELQDVSNKLVAVQTDLTTATAERNTFAQQAADGNAFAKAMNAYWGMGAILYGIVRLGWHILIVLVVVGVIYGALCFFIPALPMAGRVVGVVGRVIHTGGVKPPPG